MDNERALKIIELRRQVPGHRLRYYADAVDAGLTADDLRAGLGSPALGVSKEQLVRERDAYRDALRDLLTAYTSCDEVRNASPGSAVMEPAEKARQALAAGEEE